MDFKPVSLVYLVPACAVDGAAVALERPLLAVLGEATAGIGDLADAGRRENSGYGEANVGDEGGEAEKGCGAEGDEWEHLD
jgi:hypothetical protein